MKNKQETKKKATPVMKKLAREVSVDETRVVSGGAGCGYSQPWLKEGTDVVYPN